MAFSFNVTFDMAALSAIIFTFIGLINVCLAITELPELDTADDWLFEFVDEVFAKTLWFDPILFALLSLSIHLKMIL